MLNPEQYFRLILDPTLDALEMHSIDAMYLMVRTAMVESQLTHLRQLPNGPALGLMQLEPKTIYSIYRYLERRTDIRDRLLDYLQMQKLPTYMDSFVSNLSLNAAFARIKYWMNPEPIPPHSNIVAQGEYWKTHYNTAHGKGTVDAFAKHAVNLGIFN